MVRIETKLINQMEPQENSEYKIIDVSQFVSPKGDKGLKVILNSTYKTDKKEYATILWTHESAGIKSKIGAFIVALEKLDETGQPEKTIDTNAWLGTTIRIVRWQNSDREIEVVDSE